MKPLLAGRMALKHEYKEWTTAYLEARAKGDVNTTQECARQLSMIAALMEAER